MFRKIMSLFVNKKTEQKDGTEIIFNKPVPPTKAAIALTEYFKNDQNDNFGSMCSINFDDLYCTFVDYLKAYSEGDVLPKTIDIEQDLKITKRQRLDLQAKAIEENIILKSMTGKKVIYKYNINT